MPYASDHKARTRERIVVAALRLFNAEGYEATTINRVMAAAGLTHGGFYAHFDTKEALFAAAVEAAGQTARISTLVPLLKAKGRFDVATVARAYLDDLHRLDAAAGCALVGAAADVCRAGPEAKAAYAQVFDGLTAILSDAGALEGEDAGLVALLVGTMTVMRALPEGPQGDAVRRSALTLVARLVAARPEAAKAGA